VRGVPGIVVARVQAHGMAIALQALVKVLIGKIFMARRIGVCEAGIELQRSLKELESILMFLQHNRAQTVVLRGSGFELG